MFVAEQFKATEGTEKMTRDNKNGIQLFIALICFSPCLCASVAILSIQTQGFSRRIPPVSAQFGF